jgi:purine-cytosine permease-like protein
LANTELESEQLAEDFIDAPVPSVMRYGVTTITLLWITMMTNFPMVLFGFEWYRAGFSLRQVLAGAAIGCLILFAFQMWSGYMGAKSGLNYVLLVRQVFGVAGSKIVCFVWSLLFLLWYALNPVLLTDAIKGLFGLSFDTIFLAVPLAALMAINNWFNFKGVANFARYLAAPVLIAWIVSALWKTLTVTPLSVVFEPSHQSFSYALVVVPVLLIGNCMWGNEADFFRYSKSSKVATAIPLIVSILIGEILFPTAGWLLGRISHASDVASFTKFMNDYSFGNAPWVAAFVLTTSYFAVNDGNLYGAINGLENLWKSKRHNLVLVLVLVSAALSIVLSRYANALDTIATLNAVILACATIIVMFEYFLSERIFGYGLINSSSSSFQAGAFPGSGKIATWSLFAAWGVGLLTSGVIPQLKQFNLSLWILYPWFTAFFAYGIGRLISSRTELSSALPIYLRTRELASEEEDEASVRTSVGKR